MGILHSMLFLSLLLAPLSFCLANMAALEVTGAAECADCVSNNFQTSQAFAGSHVSVECKLSDGKVTTFGAGELEESGGFRVALPKEVVDGGKLKYDCFARLHNAAAAPCAAAVKIVSKSLENGKVTFAPTGNLKFSSASCNSKFLWPYFKHPPLPKLPLPPLQGWLHHPPLYKPPVPKPPVYKPPTPAYKPPTPIYKPPTPAYKPPTPIYKPPTPIYKPPTPTYKPPPFPFHHPLPPFPKIFPAHPLPPFPKITKPPFPKLSPHPLPPFPKIFPPHPFPPFPKITKPPFPKISPHPLPPFPKITFPPHPTTLPHPKLGFFTPPAVPRP